MLRDKLGCHRGCCWPCFWVVAPSSRLSQSIRSNFLHLSALDSEPGSEFQFETHQSNRVPRMFLVSFRVSFLNLAQVSCMFLIPLVSFVNLALSSRLHRWSMKFVWIVNRFSMILESFGGPKFHDFRVVWGPKLMKNRSWEVSWGQGRFWRSKSLRRHSFWEAKWGHFWA